MANSLKQDLTGKVVVIKAEVLKPEYKELKHRLFRVRGGFGAVPFTIGTALFGEYLYDSEECRMGGYDVERLATKKEIASVKRIPAKRGDKPFQEFPGKET